MMDVVTSLHDAMIPIEDLVDVFADVTPLSQNDCSDRVCVIQYPTAFALAYDYMRAIWKTNEKSGKNSRYFEVLLWEVSVWLFHASTYAHCENVVCTSLS